MEKTSPHIVALVPMRHQSERVPGKNYRQFAGKPLFHHVVNSLLECALVSDIVIDTDSPIVRESVELTFSGVRLIERPQHLRADTVSMNDVLLHDVEQVDAAFYLQTHSTNPLLSPGTITQAIRQFVDASPEYDSLFSVTKLQARLWDDLAKPVNHDPSVLLRTQDLPPMYEENSCLYIFTREIIEKRRTRIGERPLMFEMDPAEAWDIDEELDFQIAELLFRSRDQGEP